MAYPRCAGSGYAIAFLIVFLGHRRKLFRWHGGLMLRSKGMSWLTEENIRRQGIKRINYRGLRGLWAKAAENRTLNGDI